MGKEYVYFLAIVFHGDLTNVQMLTNAVIAFFCYSFAASSIYCFNDIYDVAADRKHPKNVSVLLLLVLLVFRKLMD